MVGQAGVTTKTFLKIFQQFNLTHLIPAVGGTQHRATANARVYY